MGWVFAAVLTVILVETVLRLPLIGSVRTVTQTGRQAARVMGSRNISDHWKEKAVQAYAGRMMKASLLMIGALAVLALIATVLTLLAERVWSGATATLLSWPGLLWTLIVATAYVMVRRRLFGR